MQKSKIKMQNDNEEKIKKHPIISELLKLNLPTKDYAIFGSGPMFAHGLRTDIKDVDLVARRNVLEEIIKYGDKEVALHGGSVVKLKHVPIEIYDAWGPGEWDTDELIDNAEIIDGLRFVSLENVIKWKKIYARPKDFEHIAMIEKYLNQKTMI